jgi:hypothetical protein
MSLPCLMLLLLQPLLLGLALGFLLVGISLGLVSVSHRYLLWLRVDSGSR